MMRKSLNQWLSYLNKLHTREIDLTLERISALAQSLSLTKFACPVILIGGTNGKGSVVKFLESIYLAAGYSVAAYTSPHLLRFNERLRINAEEISDEILIEAFNYLEAHRQSLSLTFFEFTTLAALYICQKTSLDVLLLEVGLGGRLDAVNIVEPDLSIITNIDLDHMDWLGPDRESIGREKMGIARAQKPLVCGDENPPQSILTATQNQSIPFYQFGQQFRIQPYVETWDWIGPDISYLQLPMPHLKLQNAATSLMAVDLLQSRLPVTQYAVITGLKKAKLSGRFEKIGEVILDVAHNPQSAQYLAEQLKNLPTTGKTRAVVGMLQDKDIAGALKPLFSCVDAWYTASLTAETPRGAPAEKLANCLTEADKNCYNFASVATALAKAMDDSSQLDRIVVFGSFYTVALAKQHLAMEKVDGRQ